MAERFEGLTDLECRLLLDEQDFISVIGSHFQLLLQHLGNIMYLLVTRKKSIKKQELSLMNTKSNNNCVNPCHPYSLAKYENSISRAWYQY
jgi:hypothetical protein